jgi:hypothetical protein
MPFSLVPSEAAVLQCKPWGSSSDNQARLQRDVYGPDGTYTQVTGPQTSLPPCQDEDFPDVPMLFATPTHGATSTPLSNSKKKERQWTKWATEVIPALLALYLSVLHASDSLHEEIPQTSAHSCSCPSHVQRISVACVYFECQNTFVMKYILCLN